jgi:hypothetical protein
MVGAFAVKAFAEIAQGLALSELRKNESEHLIPAGQRSGSMISVMPIDRGLKGMARYKLQDLIKNGVMMSHA